MGLANFELIQFWMGLLRLHFHQQYVLRMKIVSEVGNTFWVHFEVCPFKSIENLFQIYDVFIKCMEKE